MALGTGKILKVGIEIGGSVGKSLDQAIRRARASLGGLRSNLNDVAGSGRQGLKNVLAAPLWQGAAAGATGLGLAMAASVKQATQFEQSLVDIGKTAGLGAAETKALGSELLKLTASDKTNQSAEQLAAGIKTLVGSGLGLKDAQQAIQGIGRVATATGSDITEVAATSYQLMQNLRVPAAEVGKTFEVLAAAGKRGSFELKDMAAEFPRVASSAQKLGISGTKGAASLAAMLQVVRRGAADSSTAANNLVNLLEKVTSKDAVKNFKSFGVDIEKVVKNAQAKGLNPLEESIKTIQGITKGDPFKLNELFADMQVKAALAPLLKDYADYEKIRDSSLGSRGVIDEDYQKQLGTFSGRMDALRNSAQRLGIATGNALLPALTALASAVTPAVEGFAKFADKNPKLVTGLILVTGALAGLVALAPGIGATIGLIQGAGAVMAGLKLGATIAGSLGAVGPAITGIGGMLAGLGPMIAGAFTVITGPIGLTILAIVGIGAALVAAYRHVGWFRNGVNAAWEGIRAGAVALWQAIQRGWAGLVSGAQQFWAGIQSIGQRVMAFAGLVLTHWQAILGGFSQAWQGLWQIITGLLTLNADRITAGFQNLWGGVGRGFTAMGSSASIILSSVGGYFAALWNKVSVGAAAATAAVLTWLGQLPGRVAQFFEQIAAAAGRLWQRFAAAAGEAYQGAVNWLGQLPGRVAQFFEQIVTNASQAWGRFLSGVEKLGNDIVDLFRSIPGRLVSVGQAMGRGLVDGMRQGAGALWNTITGRSAPANNIRPLPGGASPTPRAFGGAVVPGRPYLVGERRPEVVEFTAPGRVIPSVGQYLARQKRKDAPGRVIAELGNPGRPTTPDPSLERIITDTGRPLVGDHLPKLVPGAWPEAAGIGAPGMTKAALNQLLALQRKPFPSLDNRPYMNAGRGRQLHGMRFPELPDSFRRYLANEHRPYLPGDQRPHLANSYHPHLPGEQLAQKVAGRSRPDIIESTTTADRFDPSIREYLRTQEDRQQERHQVPAGLTISPGAVQVTVHGGNPADVEAAVQRAMRQFQLNLESSYRSLLSD